MPKTFYISDYHFCHELALKRSRPQFKNVDEMNEFMIERHNSVVSKEDEVYILGDVIVCDDDELEEKLAATVGRLKGHLHLILGNHDYKYRDNPAFLKYFETAEESRVMTDRGKVVQLYHYPVLLWYRKTKGAYHIFGHIHDDTKGKESIQINSEPHALNACVEVNDFTPHTLKELIDKKYSSIDLIKKVNNIN